jgi:hypothetical protein
VGVRGGAMGIGADTGVDRDILLGYCCSRSQEGGGCNCFELSSGEPPGRLGMRMELIVGPRVFSRLLGILEAR